MPSKRFVTRPRHAAGAVSSSSAKIARKAAEAPTPMTSRASRKVGNPGATPHATTPPTRSARPRKTTAGACRWRARMALAG